MHAHTAATHLPSLCELFAMYAKPDSRPIAEVCIILLTHFRTPLPGIELDTLQFESCSPEQIRFAFSALVRMGLLEARTVWDERRRAYRGRLVGTTEDGRVALDAFFRMFKGQSEQERPLSSWQATGVEDRPH